MANSNQLDLLLDTHTTVLEAAAVQPSSESPALGNNRFLLPGLGPVQLPVSLAPNRRTPAQLKRVLDEIYRITHDRRCFSTCCELWWATLQRYQGGETVYMELASQWPADAVRVAKKGFHHLLEHFVYDGGFDDVLGQTYMMIRSDWGGSVLGQYFTPWPIARFATQTTLADLDPERFTAATPVSIYDPACGSGVTLLAARAHIASTFGRRALRNTRCYGQDIDHLCCRMAQIQLTMSDIPHMLRLIAATAHDLAEQARGL